MYTFHVIVNKQVDHRIQIAYYAFAPRSRSRRRDLSRAGTPGTPHAHGHAWTDGTSCDGGPVRSSSDASRYLLGIRRFSRTHHAPNRALTQLPARLLSFFHDGRRVRRTLSPRHPGRIRRRDMIDHKRARPDVIPVTAYATCKSELVQYRTDSLISSISCIDKLC